jgi:glycosyltransferase involved in cell wall biosynthesis
MRHHGPRLNIGMPVYNGEAYLAEAIESILGQDFTDYELTISDNASTDGSPAIAASYARRDSRVRVTRNDHNIGAVENFNRLCRRARGEYFKWAAADDRLAKGFLSAAIAELDAAPAAVLCYGRTTLMEADGTQIGEYIQGLDLREPDVVTRFRRAREHSGLLHVLHGVARRDVMHRTALHETFPGSDEALVVELALHGAIHEIEAPMLFRRLHAEAASASKSPADRQEHLDPKTAGRLVLWYSTHASAHLRSILRAPLPRSTKLRLIGIVLRGMVSLRDKHLSELRSASARLMRSRRGTDHTVRT